MSGAFGRLMAVGIVAGALAGCAGSDELSGGGAPDDARDSQVMTPDTPLQCVPYARENSRVNLHGDAYTWWDQAAGRYARGSEPKPGAVLVLSGYAGPNHAHLAVVHDVLSAREIRVNHANWLNDGAIYINDPVVDVSDGNDWSAVRVWNIRAGAWGGRTYPALGFIGPDRDSGSDRVASGNSAGQASGGLFSDSSLESDR